MTNVVAVPSPHRGNDDRVVRVSKVEKMTGERQKDDSAVTRTKQRTDQGRNQQQKRGLRPAAAAGSGIESQCKGEEPADAASAACPVRQALTAAGIGEPARSRLAESWKGIPDAAQRIRTTADDLRERGKRGGAIIRELEALALAEAERACAADAADASDAAAARRAAELAKQRADDAARAREAAQDDRDRALLESLTDQQLTALASEMRIKQTPDQLRRRFWHRPAVAAAARARGWGGADTMLTRKRSQVQRKIITTSIPATCAANRIRGVHELDGSYRTRFGEPRF